MEKKSISDLINEFNLGLAGAGPVLWHKKMHKNGSGEFACVKGIINGCENVINCGNCYVDNTGGYCLNQGGENVGGFLAVEYKHQELVSKNAFGAYDSIVNAMKNAN
jgi:hypothetical protein